MAKNINTKKKKQKKEVNTQKVFALFCVGIMVISLLSSIVIYFI